MVIAVGLARLTSFAIGSCSMEQDLKGFAMEPRHCGGTRKTLRNH